MNGKQILWMCGLSKSGKSTLAEALYNELLKRKVPVAIIECSSFRLEFCPELGFSNYERFKQHMLMSDQALTLLKRHDVVIVDAISSLEASRLAVQDKIGDGYSLVYVDTPISVCESRDSKGLYEKARMGHLEHFSGVSSQFDIPKMPDVKISFPEPLAKSVQTIIQHLQCHHESRGMV